MPEPRLRLNLSKRKVKTPKDIRNDEEKRRRKEIRKKFGKPGRRIAKRDVPETPNVRVSRRPTRYKATDKRVVGFKANIHSRGSGSVPGRELYVSKTILFGTKDRENPISFKSARSAIPQVTERLQRIYQGRIDLIGVKLEYIYSKRGKRELHGPKKKKSHHKR